MYLTPQNGPTAITPIEFLYEEDITAPASGSWSVDDVRCNRAYTVRMKAFSNEPYAGPLQVVGACPVKIGDVYQYPLTLGATEKDTGSFCTSIRAEPGGETAKGFQWTVTIEYTPFDVQSLLGTSDISNGIINPLDRYLEVFWDSAKYQRSKVTDESGQDGEPGVPYVNTIGDPLDVPAIEETRPVLNVVRMESAYNDAYASQFKDTVNADEFLGYPPNAVKCKDIKGERVNWDPDWGWPWKVTYQFEFRDDDDGNGYTQLILNAGYRQKKNGTGNPVNVVDANNQQVTDAVPLQQNGAYTPGADPYFIPFVEFPSVEFADLNIPDDVLYIAAGNF